MLITTQDNLITSTKWWKQMRIDGDQIIVQTDPKAGEVQKVLLATVKDKATKDALFDEMNVGIKNGKAHFDVNVWADSYEAASGE